MGDGSYSLRPGELDLLITDLRLCQRTLATELADLRRQVRRLHETWEGLSASAQAVAQQAIEDGLATMSAALGDFTTAKEDARSGYQVVWDANVALWREVS